MAVSMTSLRRAPNGDWFARKGIPAAIRAAYKTEFGVSQEERFRRPASLSLGRAKEALREWDALITSRIENLKAAQSGIGRTISVREAHGLCAQWYAWFAKRYEGMAEEASDPIAWDAALDELQAISERDERPDYPPGYEHELSPKTQALVRGYLHDAGKVSTFLLDQGITLSDQSRDLFLDHLQTDFISACNHLARRAQGNYDRDPKAPTDDRKALFRRHAGKTVKQLFATWVEARKPKAQTIQRWRGVFLSLQARFPDKDISEITTEQANEWKNALVAEGTRSPRVVQDTWLRSAQTVFQFAVDEKMIAESPFKGLKVAWDRKTTKLREKHFRPDEAWAILRAAQGTFDKKLKPHKAAARRWIPWLCAYSGCRSGEAAQLRAEDIVHERGRWWCMRITPEAGTVKTGEARLVPLHRDLVEQGFLDYVGEVGSGPLFYDAAAVRPAGDDPTNPRRPPWVITRIKLAEWVRNIVGVTDAGIGPNHAWRHLFKTRAEHPTLGLGPALIDKITGHVPANVGDAYRGAELGQLVTLMDKVPRYRVEEDVPSDWDEDISRSCSTKYSMAAAV